ncbi:hypothetical protein RYX56_15405 [Alkalihalophilus lindianensis]|uniref:Uncharacterized protein n=1 Tax=Alkalihalophilus lindianensis TaxID=1630542 RepID=A0ABU3XCY6_9BACI|nr:hypothetical protein [Alkalihalophilus lindianensis]MDV2685752.1 hypothetical protein [Alkalihalophilus lindianensis]
MLTEDTITLIENIMMIFILSQVAYATLVFILGFIMVDYYEWGVFRPAETWFQKLTNGIMKSLFGLGPYFYQRY